MAVLRDVLIVRAESLHHRQSIEYVGICEAFHERYIGDDIPTYVAKVFRNDDGTVRLEGWEMIA